MGLHLQEITKDTVRAVCALSVRDEQSHYVSTNALSMAEAHFEPSAVFRAIYLEKQPIGFVQWRKAETVDTVVLWRFMIDRAHQAAGHGGAALALALEKMRSNGFKTAETSVVLGPSSPFGFYLRHGFEEVGRTTPHGEWLLRQPL